MFDFMEEAKCTYLYDNKLLEVLEQILNCRLSDDAWNQISLPVDKGGFGIRNAVHCAIPCFLASVYSSQHLIQKIIPDYCDEVQITMAEAEGLWKGILGLVLPQPDLRGLQKTWEEPQNIRRFNNLLDSTTTPESKARLLAVSSPSAGAWLKCLPSLNLGTLLKNQFFHISCALRLGCEICHAHTCRCGSKV